MLGPNVIITILAVIEHNTVQAYTSKELITLLSASFLMIFGALSLNGAVCFGKGGPS